MTALRLAPRSLSEERSDETKGAQRPEGVIAAAERASTAPAAERAQRDEAPQDNRKTDVFRRIRPPRPAGSGGSGRPPRRPRPSRLPLPGPRPKAPRDGRWWVGVALLSVSLVLLAFVAHVAVVSALQHYRAQTIAYGDLRTSLAKAETPVGQLVSETEMTRPGTPVALFEAPAIGLSEVVLEGTTSEVLRSGIGHRRDSVMPGQAGSSVILGRQATYGGPFSRLSQLQPGDTITVTTGQGTSTFKVFGLRRAGDPMPPALAKGAGRLELMTADGLALFPSGVLHVDAALVSQAKQTPSLVMGEPALPTDERAMGQNDQAWYIAFFLAVFSLAAVAGVIWLWRTWGRWHAWLIGVPVLLAFGVTTADVVMSALPNLL